MKSFEVQLGHLLDHDSTSILASASDILSHCSRRKTGVI